MTTASKLQANANHHLHLYDSVSTMNSYRILSSNSHRLLLLLLLPSHLLASSTTTKSTIREEELPSEQWYTKYKSYPDYCSTPTQLQQRSIPPLQYQHKQHAQEGQDYQTPNKIHSKILHVTAVIRHGARTISKPHKCWDGFWSLDSDTAFWNCELTTMVAPPSSYAIRQCKANPNECNTNGNDNNDNNNDSENINQQEIDGEGAMFLFDKQYDVLQHPPQLKNQLNGTCQMGQLLLRGYEQELHNGQMLRRTYVKENEQTNNSNSANNANIDNDYNHSNSGSSKDAMVLFDLTDETYAQSGNRPYEEPHLYYRADDDQRTLMSGQVLLRGLFGDLLLEHSEQLGVHSDPTIVLHTADRSRDVLSRNGEICPRLDEIEESVIQSQEYKDEFENSKEGQILNSLMENELGGNFQKSAQVSDGLRE